MARSVRWIAWRVSLEPTPATIVHVAVPRISSTARRITPRCSSSSRVEASPVVPHTTSPSEPCSTRWCISATAASSSTLPSASNGVTIAVRIDAELHRPLIIAGGGRVRLTCLCARPRRAPTADPWRLSEVRGRRRHLVLGLGRLGHDVGDRGVGQLADPLGQPRVQPLGEAHGERRDDDLVVALRVPRVGHGQDRVGVADAAPRLQAGGVELLERLLELGDRRLSPAAERRGRE